MNYGFVDVDPRAKPLDLSASDEKDRLYIQLYHVAGALAFRS